MKIGFTDGNRNIYELKKQNSIKFGQSNAISQKKTVVQKDSDDKKKTDKNQNMGKIALAVTVPTLVIGGALAAYYISKGKKKTINASKIVPKAEKEITKNDLLKDSKEVSKILKVFVAPNNGTPLKLSRNDSVRILTKINSYEISLDKIFTKQVAQNIIPHLSKIKEMISIFLSDKGNESFVLNDNYKKEGQAALKEINNFIKLLQKYDSLDSVKNAILDMAMKKKSQRKTHEISQKRDKALKITNDAQIKAHTINTQANFDYKFKEKNINKAQFVLDSNGKKYLVFDNTSDIIPNETKKKQSGFTIEGMGDSRFFAIALDGISRENLLNMIKNPEVLKQFNGESATEEAQEFFSSTLNLQQLSTEDVANLATNDRAFATTDVVQQYITEHIVIPDENPEEVIEQIAQNQGQKLTLILAAPNSGVIPQITKHISVDLLENDDKKEQIRQQLIESIGQSPLSSTYQFYIRQLQNMSAINALKDAKPKELISKYHSLLELNKDEVGMLSDNAQKTEKNKEYLFISNDGTIHKNQDDDIPLNNLYKIYRQNEKIYINDLMDNEIIYEEKASDGQDQKLTFGYLYKNIQQQIKDIVEMSNIFDLNIVKPLLYNMKNALTAQYYYPNGEEKSDTLVQTVKANVENLLNNFDTFKTNDEKIKSLESIYNVELSSLNMYMPFKQKELEELLESKYFIDTNSPRIFMKKFVLDKFGTKYSKPVYKEIVTLDGQKVENVGYEIQDAMDKEQKVLNKNKSTKFDSRDPYNTYSAAIRSAYRYTLNDGKQYTITQLLRNPDMTVDKPGTVMLYRIASSKKDKDTSKVKYEQITKDFVKHIEQDPVLEALFVYNLDSCLEQEKYFKAKIANALESNPCDWANKVQNIIHTMYSLNLINEKDVDDYKRPQQCAQEVYKEFITKGTSNVLYITPDGDVLASPDKKIKPDCYVLTLG